MQRPLSNAQREGSQARTDIRQGMLEYTDDAIDVRRNLFPGYRPPLDLPQELFMAFAGRLSASEKALLQSLVLDDYYCGHGLV